MLDPLRHLFAAAIETFFWKLSKTKIYIKILLLWVQFKHRVGKIAHRAHWSRGNMPENFIPLFSNEEKKTCIEWKPSILIWPRCRSWRFPLSVPGSRRWWLMISRRWALEERWPPNLISQLTNSGKEGWDQSSGRVTSWIRKSYPLLINLPPPCCEACSGTCRSSTHPSETGSSPSFLVFSFWSVAAQSGGTFKSFSTYQQRLRWIYILKSLEWERMGVKHLVLIGRDQSDKGMTNLH